MADLPSSPILKINDLETAQDSPITQALMTKIGTSLNGVIDRALVYVEFFSSTTWTAPTTVSRVLAIGCGGGGGGGGGGTTFTNTFFPASMAGAGGSGVAPVYFTAAVTPGATYTITIGAGGAAGAKATPGGISPGFAGSDGGESSVGSIMFFPGGTGGAGGQYPANVNNPTGSEYAALGATTLTRAGVAARGGNGRGPTFSYAGENGFGSFLAAGGAGGTAVGQHQGGGGGGAGIGTGGAGGYNAGGSPVLPTVGGIGAGGGGGVYLNVGGPNPNDSTAGSAGGPGYILLAYI